jgi:excisionase family DNA binding protein
LSLNPAWTEGRKELYSSSGRRRNRRRPDTVNEVAAILRVHPNTIYKKAKKGEIPSIRTANSQVRFIEEDIKEWLDRSSLRSSSSPLINEALRADFSLENHDKLFLKGGVRMSPKGKTWNYPFGSVYLRLTRDGKERWHIYYRADGKRIRRAVRGAQNRADALKVLQVEVADSFRGKYGFKKARKRVTFREFAFVFLEKYSKVHKLSWRSDVSIVNKLDPYFGSNFLDEITPGEIDEFKAARLEEGRTKSKVNRDLALLRKIFNVAIDWGHVDASPMGKVKFFSEKDNLKERILSEPEEKRLLQACPPYLRIVVLTALYTGMRRGEVLGLRWGQVDFKKSQIKVEKTKSGRIRLIPMGERLRDELLKLRAENPSAEFVFLYPPTKRPIQDVKKAFRSATCKAGTKGLRFHDLRHTYASRLVANGVDIITVRDLLGHHSVEVTQRYTHSNEAQKRLAVETLEEEPKDVHALSTRREGVPTNLLNAAN